MLTTTSVPAGGLLKQGLLSDAQLFSGSEAVTDSCAADSRGSEIATSTGPLVLQSECAWMMSLGSEGEHHPGSSR
jgi:hypothetical protein